ncbi:membrane hypothetical protein [Mesorhizobium metallidurans STM 2683]|uniref:Uncharacterized protein n=1 Tax=Mesorhizobium metallidurans STM 2683 TaxID=1297569 RepID=M5EUA6_9HYPH|nr:membrane hypothetical protein [Mesorhizobium metallidurans STM 2683]
MVDAGLSLSFTKLWRQAVHMMPAISDASILSQTTASGIVFIVLSSFAFYCVRELLSAWRTGSIQSKIGLVHRSSDVVTFRRLVGAIAIAAALASLCLFAVTPGLMRNVFGISDLRVGGALTVLVLFFLVILAAKFRR